MIETKINSNKKFSLLIYCLIIGVVFVNNIHNNILGIDSQPKLQELTEEQRKELVDCIMDNMSVEDKDKKTVKSNIEKLAKGWKLKNQFTHNLYINLDNYHLINTEDKEVLFPIIDFHTCKICSNDVVNIPNEYPKDCRILFFKCYVSNDAKIPLKRYQIQILEGSTIKKDLVKTHEFLTKGNDRYDLSNISVAKVREDNTWKTQLINAKTNEPMIIDNSDVQNEITEHFHKLWNQSVNVYGDNSKYINPFAITEEKKKKLMKVFADYIDNYALVPQEVEKYVQDKITSNYLFTNLNGDWINKDYKTILIPLNEGRKICKMNTNEKITFYTIGSGSVFNKMFGVQEVLNNKNLDDIKDKIVNLNKELMAANISNLTIFYLIKENGEYQLEFCHGDLGDISKKIPIDTEDTLNTILKLYKLEIFDICEELKLDEKIPEAKIKEEERLAVIKAQKIEAEKNAYEKTTQINAVYYPQTHIHNYSSKTIKSQESYYEETHNHRDGGYTTYKKRQVAYQVEQENINNLYAPPESKTEVLKTKKLKSNVNRYNQEAVYDEEINNANNQQYNKEEIINDVNEDQNKIKEGKSSNNVVIGGIIVTVGIVGTGILGLYYKEKQKDKNKKAIIKNESKEEEIIEELNKNNQKRIKPIKKNKNRNTKKKKNT